MNKGTNKRRLMEERKAAIDKAETLEAQKDPATFDAWVEVGYLDAAVEHAQCQIIQTKKGVRK